MGEVHAVEPRAESRPRRRKAAVGQAQPRDVALAGAEVVRELVAHDARDLAAQDVGIASEVAHQRVAEDHDAVGVSAIGDRAAHVQAVTAMGAVAASVVGDEHGDVSQELGPEMLGELVDGFEDESLEAVAVSRDGGRSAAGGRRRRARLPLDRRDEALELGVGHRRHLALRAALGQRLDMRAERDERHEREHPCEEHEAAVAGQQREGADVTERDPCGPGGDRPAGRQRSARLALRRSPIALAASRGADRLVALASSRGALR